MKYEDLLSLIEAIKQKNSALEVDVEHENVHTVYLGNIPIFKAIYTEENKVPEIFIMFHLDITPVRAIYWFGVISNINRKVQLTESYYEDAEGNTYIGPDAVLLRTEKMKSDIIYAYESMKESQKNMNAAGKGPNDNLH